MDAFSTLIGLALLAYGGEFFLRWWLANNHPGAYESYKRIDSERKQGMANAAMKSAQFGVGVARYFLRK
jgi:hypothetical protein